MNVNTTFKADLNKTDFLQKTKDYFLENKFKLEKEAKDDLVFSRGNVILNLITFNPLQIKSKVKISFEESIINVDVDINTTGQMITEHEKQVWDDFVNNYKQAILTGG